MLSQVVGKIVDAHSREIIGYRIYNADTDMIVNLTVDEALDIARDKLLQGCKVVKTPSGKYLLGGDNSQYSVNFKDLAVINVNGENNNLSELNNKQSNKNKCSESYVDELLNMTIELYKAYTKYGTGPIRIMNKIVYSHKTQVIKKVLTLRDDIRLTDEAYTALEEASQAIIGDKAANDITLKEMESVFRLADQIALSKYNFRSNFILTPNRLKRSNINVLVNKYFTRSLVLGDLQTIGALIMNVGDIDFPIRRKIYSKDNTGFYKPVGYKKSYLKPGEAINIATEDSNDLASIAYTLNLEIFNNGEAVPLSIRDRKVKSIDGDDVISCQLRLKPILHSDKESVKNSEYLYDHYRVGPDIDISDGNYGIVDKLDYLAIFGKYLNPRSIVNRSEIKRDVIKREQEKIKPMADRISKGPTKIKTETLGNLLGSFKR